MSRAVALSGWAVIVVTVAAAETVGRRRSDVLPPLSGLVTVLRRSRGGRSALLLCWVWVGWHLFVR